MKLTKTKLKEIVREIMLEDVMDKQIKNPKTGNKIKLGLLYNYQVTTQQTKWLKS